MLQLWGSSGSGATATLRKAPRSSSVLSPMFTASLCLSSPPWQRVLSWFVSLRKHLKCFLLHYTLWTKPLGVASTKDWALFQPSKCSSFWNFQNESQTPASLGDQLLCRRLQPPHIVPNVVYWNPCHFLLVWRQIDLLILLNSISNCLPQFTPVEGGAT